MIPNTAITKPRTKKDGDFYACRRCNGKKSKIDYVLGVISRAQSHDTETAVAAMRDAVLSDRPISRLFVEMLQKGQEAPDGLHMKLPISGRDLYDYLVYLAKGQHFKCCGTPIDSNQQVIQVQFVNKQVLAPLESAYEGQRLSNPFEDLVDNPNSESLSGGEVVIWSGSNEYLFLFHRYIGVIARVAKWSRSSYRKARAMERQILRDFSR